MTDVYGKATLTVIALLLAGILGERIWRGAPPQIDIPEPCGLAIASPCYVTLLDASGRPVSAPDKPCGSHSDPCQVQISEEPAFGSFRPPPSGTPLNPVKPPAGQGGLRPPPRP